MALVQNDIYKILLESIKERIPQKTKLANLLTDLLSIEKEAVYRRLRGEVPFTFSEIVKISRAFNISLDGMIGINNSQTYPFQLKLAQYYNPTQIDYNMHVEFIDILANNREDRYSEVGLAARVLPLHFTLEQESIHRFYTLCWLYQFGDTAPVPSFSEIFFPEKMRSLFQQYLIEVENFKCTSFIWDKFMFASLVKDINYFYSIKMISSDDKILLKKEIRSVLDNLEELSIHGKFKNGNKVDIYISSLNIDTTYTYMQIGQYQLSMIRAFTCYELVSLDAVVYDNTKRWLQALKRTSKLISGSNEMDRILFFDEQRDMVERNL